MSVRHRTEFYTRPNGRRPASEWLDALADEHAAAILAKIDKLSEYGTELTATNMMKRIHGYQADLYELRGGQCRLALYYDRSRDLFVLLHGFLKKSKKEQGELAEAGRLLEEYLSFRGEEK